MGAWSEGIFDNDTAMDMYDELKELSTKGILEDKVSYIDDLMGFESLEDWMYKTCAALALQASAIWGSDKFTCMDKFRDDKDLDAVLKMLRKHYEGSKYQGFLGVQRMEDLENFPFETLLGKDYGQRKYKAVYKLISEIRAA